MENKVMNSEQVKAEKFFNRLWKNSTAKVASWFLTGIFLFLIMILCMLPAQEMFAEEWQLFMPSIVTMLTCMMMFFRSAIYDQYNENQKSRFMADILKYHPINRKEVWKYKTKKLTTFLAKVTGVGLVFQILVALIAYHSISWLNFFYIVVFLLGFPMTAVLTFDSITKKLGEL